MSEEKNLRSFLCAELCETPTTSFKETQNKNCLLVRGYGFELLGGVVVE